jgi:hypothetical protein
LASSGRGPLSRPEKSGLVCAIEEVPTSLVGAGRPMGDLRPKPLINHCVMQVPN